MKKVDVLIVGGGPAGLAAAVELYRKNIRNILIVERENHLGGILKQLSLIHIFSFGSS